MKIDRKNFPYSIFILCLILIVPFFFIKDYFVVRAKRWGRTCAVEDFHHVDLKPIEEKSFALIVLTKNNIESIHLNFHSICRQRYLNYRVIYIDRGSTDGTLRNIKAFAKHYPSKIALVMCERDSELYRKYHEVVNSSPDREIIVHLHGSGWLAHRDVLSNLNQCYANDNVWLTYGEYLDDLGRTGLASRPKLKGLFHKKSAFRKVSWVSAPFKSFYSALFRRIEENSTYSPSVKDDKRLLSPIAKMGRAHIGFIPGGVICRGNGLKRQERREKFCDSLVKKRRLRATSSTPSVSTH